MIPYGKQEISDADVEAVANALRAQLITQGPTVDKFEEALAQKVGARYAVAFNSGTAALHAAYFAAGLTSGWQVITSPITFVATANAALYLGGTVRFADVDADTALLDPEAVSQFVTDHTVIVPVHLSGHVAALEQLHSGAEARGAVVVEDAAHALGASYSTADGRSYLVGSCAHSSMCCLSFHPVKHITTGEGGAVTTNDRELYSRLRRFRTHGITRNSNELEDNHGPWYYEQHDLGFNYRITDVQCALGLSQLVRLDEWVARRREIAATYDAAFAEEPAIRVQAGPALSTGSYHLYVIRVDAERRRSIFERLRNSGIGVNVHYIPVYKQPYYRRHGYADITLRNAETYYAEAISLPMFPALTESDQSFVIEQTIAAVRATNQTSPAAVSQR